MINEERKKVIDEAEIISKRPVSIEHSMSWLGAAPKEKFDVEQILSNHKNLLAFCKELMAENDWQPIEAARQWLNKFVLGPQAMEARDGAHHVGFLLDVVERLESELEDSKEIVLAWKAKADNRADEIGRLKSEVDALQGRKAQA